MAKSIPQSSIENLIADLESKVARKHIYTDIDAMVLAAAQETQKVGELIRVTDASADVNVVTGSAYYDYTGAATEDLGDYFLVSAPENASLADGIGTSANGNSINLASASNIAYDIEWVRVNGDDNLGHLLKSGEIGNYYQNFVTKIRNEHIARADIAYMRSIDNDQGIGAAIHSDPAGYLIVSNSVAGYDFHGLKYSDDYALIDWASDDLLIPHQKRVRELIAQASKIWYVDTDYGDDSGVGSFQVPFATLQKAIDVREADGELYAVIEIMNVDLSSQNGVISSNPTFITVIRGAEKLVFLNNLTINDSSASLYGIAISGTLTINQTGSNLASVNLQRGSDVSNYAESVATATKAIINLYDGSKLAWSLTTATTYKTELYARFGSEIALSGSSSATLAKIHVVQSRLDSLGGFTITSLLIDSSFIQLSANSPTIITGAYSRTNCKVFGTRQLDISGSTNIIVEDERVNFGDPVIATLISGVASVLPSGTISHNMVIAAESGTADDMIEFTGLRVGDEILFTSDTGDTITVKHNDAGATIKIHMIADSDFILDEMHPLKLVLMSANVLAQV